jgi:hypothetical protein
VIEEVQESEERNERVGNHHSAGELGADQAKVA